MGVSDGVCVGAGVAVGVGVAVASGVGVDVADGAEVGVGVGLDVGVGVVDVDGVLLGDVEGAPLIKRLSPLLTEGYGMLRSVVSFFSEKSSSPVGYGVAALAFFPPPDASQMIPPVMVNTDRIETTTITL